MPLDTSAPITITGFDNVPPFAQGMVRDIRVRWACEEIGKPYTAQLMDAFEPRPDGYRDWQPFGQVPAFDDGAVRLFESGAILLYLGEQDERLLPRDAQQRWSTVAWMIAALNSVEPALMNIVWLDVFNAGMDWAEAARPAALEFAKSRLQSAEHVLDDKEWLVGRFTLADIMMVTVLRNIRHTDMLDEFPKLKTYRRRGEARPAFRQALADQLAGFPEAAVEGE